MYVLRLCLSKKISCVFNRLYLIGYCRDHVNFNFLRFSAGQSLNPWPVQYRIELLNCRFCKCVLYFIQKFANFSKTTKNYPRWKFSAANSKNPFSFDSWTGVYLLRHIQYRVVALLFILPVPQRKKLVLNTCSAVVERQAPRYKTLTEITGRKNVENLSGLLCHFFAKDLISRSSYKILGGLQSIHIQPVSLQFIGSE